MRDCEICRALITGPVFWIGEHIFATKNGFRISLAPRRHVDSVTSLSPQEVQEMALEAYSLLGLAESDPDIASQPRAFNIAFEDMRRWPTSQRMHVVKHVIFDVPNVQLNIAAAELAFLAWKGRARV